MKGVGTDQFTLAQVDGDELPFTELSTAIDELEAAGRPVDALKGVLWHKISGPLSAILMPLLGAVAAFGLARSGKLFVRAILGMALGFAYFVADNFALAMGDLGAYTPFYAAYAGTKAPVEHFTRAASKEFGERGISVTAIGPGPMDTPFFYPAEGDDAVAYHKSAAALSPFSKTGLTDIEDIVPWIRMLVSEGWWMTGQTILVNGGYTTK